MDDYSIGKGRFVWVGLSTDTKPPKAIRGQEAIESDTGNIFQWLGDENGNGAWVRRVNGGSQVSYVENPHEFVVNEHFHLHTGVATTLAAAVSPGDTSIEVVSTVGFSVGNEIQILDGTIEVTFPVITAIAGPVLTLDKPVDNGFSIGDLVEGVETDIASTAGTLATPIQYRVEPTTGEEWSIARILIVMTFPTAGDDSKFGDIASLANGLTIRFYDGLAGTYRTITNWKNNGDIIHDGYDASYNTKSGGGLFGFVARWTFERIGAEPKIHGDHGDFLEVLVQDDITALASVQIKAQGFIDD
jgi:hypothetical protein